MATQRQRIGGTLALFPWPGLSPWLGLAAMCWACGGDSTPEPTDLGGGQSGVESLRPPANVVQVVQCPCDFADSVVVVRGVLVASEACASGRRALVRVEEVLAGEERAQVAVGDALRGGQGPCDSDLSARPGDAVVALYRPSIEASGGEGRPTEPALTLFADGSELVLGEGKRLDADDAADLGDRSACETHFPPPVEPGSPDGGGGLPGPPGAPSLDPVSASGPAADDPEDADDLDAGEPEDRCPPLDAWPAEGDAGDSPLAPDADAGGGM